MQKEFIDINSIADLHDYYNYGSPKHPLATVIDLGKVTSRKRKPGNVFYRLGLYAIMYKKFKGELKYGRSVYDFNEGSLIFVAPNQVLSPSEEIRFEKGWFLAFHPDLLHNSALGRNIHQYTFFKYEVNEALHISETEEAILNDGLHKIIWEYSQQIDVYTKGLIINNLELLLNYGVRFYNRQFITREKVNNDIVQRFEDFVQRYFDEDSLIEKGLPDVKYFAERLNLSSDYLSDVLKKYTGKTTLETIHLHLVEKAKSLLLGTHKPVSEIAYELGFEHPSHFTKLFKAKTNHSPSRFRTSFN